LVTFFGGVITIDDVTEMSLKVRFRHDQSEKHTLAKSRNLSSPNFKGGAGGGKPPLLGDLKKFESCSLLV